MGTNRERRVKEREKKKKERESSTIDGSINEFGYLTLLAVALALKELKPHMALTYVN